MDGQEQTAFSAVERLGPVNTMTLYSARISLEAVSRLLERGILQYFGGGGVKLACPTRLAEIARTEAHVQKTDNAVGAPAPATPRKPRRATYSKVTGLWPDRVRQMEARIVHWLQMNGEHDEYRPACSISALKRGLHATRYRDEFPAALDSLVKRNGIKLEDGAVMLRDPLAADEQVPDPFDPQGKKRAKEEKQRKRDKRGRRPRTAWFEELLRRQ
jgi:hypothetical protein